MDQLEEIRSKIDIVQFLSEYIPLKRAGRNFKALCPFHTEKTPSFIVSPERQIWHCFGSCGDGGDVFKFLMKWENLEFPEALKILAKKAGITLRQYQPTEQVKLKERIYEINHLTSEFYHYLLTSHNAGQKALAYALERGISQKSIDFFRLGYAPSLWDGLIKFLVGKKGYMRQDLEKAGLVVTTEEGRKDYYDRFRNRLIFTLKDHRGNVVGFAGRTLTQDPGEAKYINTPETPVYIKGNVLYGLEVTREAIKKAGEAIIVEGEIDTIASFQAGVQNVVAIKGSALTEGQVKLLRRYTENIALALDVDSAGDAAVRRGIEIADQAGLNIKVIQLKGVKDPAECLKEKPDLWPAAITQAVPFYDFLLDSAFKRYGQATAAGKKKIGEELLPVFAKIENEIVKDFYLKKLAKRLEVAPESLWRQLAKLLPVAKGETGPSPILIPKKQKEEVYEEYLLSLLFQSENPQAVMAEIQGFLSAQDFFSPVLKKLFALLAKFLKKEKKWQIGKFGKSLPEELVATCDRLFLKDLKIEPDGEIFKKEIKKVAKEIKILALKRSLREIGQKIKEAQKDKELKDLNQRFQEISQTLKEFQKPTELN